MIGLTNSDAIAHNYTLVVSYVLSCGNKYYFSCIECVEFKKHTILSQFCARIVTPGTCDICFSCYIYLNLARNTDDFIHLCKYLFTNKSSNTNANNN